jgi:hypothetical protein
MHILVGHINRRERERDDKKKRRAGVGEGREVSKRQKSDPSHQVSCQFQKEKKNEIKEEKKIKQTKNNNNKKNGVHWRA